MAATENMDGMGRTSIQVSDELADELHGRKNRGESYEDVVWRLIEAADAQEDIAESDSSGVVVENVEPERTDREAKRETYRDLEPAPQSLDDVEFPATKDPEECIEAVNAAYEYLRANGKATMREFVQEVMPEHPCGYDVPQLEPGERYRGAWWRKVVKPGLEALPDVESPPTGGSDWTYTGE